MDAVLCLLSVMEPGKNGTDVGTRNKGGVTESDLREQTKINTRRRKQLIEIVALRES